MGGGLQKCGLSPHEMKQVEGNVFERVDEHYFARCSWLTEQHFQKSITSHLYDCMLKHGPLLADDFWDVKHVCEVNSNDYYRNNNLKEIEGETSDEREKRRIERCTKKDEFLFKMVETEHLKTLKEEQENQEEQKEVETETKTK